MKHLIIATTPLQAKITQHIKGLYPNQDFVSLYVSPVKNARQEHYAKDFDHVHYPQTAEDLAQICQELAGDYDTIFYASFDNSLILDLVASSIYQHLMSFMMAMRIFTPWECMLVLSNPVRWALWA